MAAEIDRKLEAALMQLVDTRLEDAVPRLLEQFIQRNETRAREVSLMERIVRVEEELKALREVEAAHFQATEKRFEALQRELQVRFEATDKRLAIMQWFIGIGFTVITVLVTLARFL